MRLSIVHKLSLSFVLLVLISSGVVGGLFYNKTTGLLVKHALQDIASEAQSAGQMLQTIVNTHDEDVLFLANTPPIQGMLKTRLDMLNNSQDNSSYAQWQERLEKIFESQLKRKSTYLSIRFIDRQGQELVHVGYQNSRVVHFRDKNLQNKSNRIYVREALKLPAGSIYVSEINLNREFGKLITPHQEVKRSATPVYNEKNNSLAGLVVITAEIGQDLRAIQNRLGQKKGSEFFITNDQGGYLLHPDQNKTYGFDLGKNFRIQEYIPQLSRLYLPGNNDLQVILMPGHNNGNKVINFTKISFDPAHPGRFIAVILSQDYDSIVAEQSEVLNNISIWALLLILISAAAGVVFSIQVTRPIKQMTRVMNDFTHQRPVKTSLPIRQKDEIGMLARSFESMIQQVCEYQNSLRKLNDNLEKKVSERTHSLELSEAHQRTILESIADAIITIDGKGLITSFNQAAEKIFGYQSDKIIGKDISILLPEKKRKIHQNYLENKSLYASQIIDQTRDVEGQRKDGSLFPVELMVTVMKGKKQQGFVGVLRDITDRKRIDKIKNEFISTVSHELRTPLTSIHGSLALISGGAAGEVSEQVNKLIEIADNNTRRLLLLINDILDIQKIESNQMSFDLQCIEVFPFVKQALEDNTGYGEQYGVKFIITQSDTKLKMFADKDRLMQVMANFLSNAAKFSTKGNAIEVSMTRHQNSTIRISVTNHGSCIPKEFQSKIFEKFTQLDSSDTRQKGGTGLGLSIARAIIEKHNGRINFTSRKESTTFYFDLPDCS